MQILSDIGEISLIKHICANLPSKENVIVGPGDDCAVVRLDDKAEYDILLTSDPVIENVHFTPDTNPADIGHKAVGRVLSDIAAMGGEPLWCLLNTAAPKTTPVRRIEDIFSGASALAEQCSVSIVGGDTSEGSVLTINAFAVGKTKRASAILRSGASAGDIIFVTGSLGNSITDKHLSFTPRIEEGLYLREKATSAIDITDGFIVDLRRILESSSVGAKICLDKIPVSEAALASSGSKSPLEHALSDGEDFELLFTIPAEKKDSFISGWKKASLVQCTEVGITTSKAGLIEFSGPGMPIDLSKATGYLHFNRGEDQ